MSHFFGRTLEIRIQQTKTRLENFGSGGDKKWPRNVDPAPRPKTAHYSCKLFKTYINFSYRKIITDFLNFNYCRIVNKLMKRASTCPETCAAAIFRNREVPQVTFWIHTKIIPTLSTFLCFIFSTYSQISTLPLYEMSITKFHNYLSYQQLYNIIVLFSPWTKKIAMCYNLISQWS